MLDNVNEYLKALDAREIRTHKDALNFFSVRYSSFGQNYPKKCLIPGCLLAQHGFHFDANTNAILCVECTFVHDRLDDEDLTLSSVLARHFQFNSSCKQAKHSLSNSLEEAGHDSDNENESNKLELVVVESGEDAVNPSDDATMDLNNNTNEVSDESALKAKYITIESRIKTFEHAKMLLDRNRLAETGLFLVLRETSQNQPIAVTSAKTEQTQIEKVAHSIPFLHHVKCAFCAYECLLFRNSLLNTYYKSPFDEHREKYGAKCPIFVDSVEENETGSSYEKTNLPDWLKMLYEFEAGSGNNESYSSRSNETLAPDKSVEVKSMPKIIEHLVAYNLNMNQLPSNRTSQTTSGMSNPVQNLIYMPKASSALPANTAVITTTSDFNQLQTVLNQTHNVMSVKAYSPAFTQLQARLETFREWPATLSQQPADLAKAGFYYFGIKDMVKCFFCNGGLKNWDHNDDPYEDHVRWFPKCQYIRQLMGVEYIEKVREKFKNEESGFNNGDPENTNAAGGASSSGQTADPTYGSLTRASKSNGMSGGTKKRSTSPRSLNSRLDTHIIRKILDSNILTRDSIKQSFDIKLSMAFDVCGSAPVTAGNYADDFKSPVDLAMFAYDLDKAKTSKLELIGSISDFMICNLPERLVTANVREFMWIKYGVDPAHIRILKCKSLNEESKSYCLVSLKTQDKPAVDEIIKDLEKGSMTKYFKKSEEDASLFAFKTNWPEIEEKVKPLLGKDTSALAAFQIATAVAHNSAAAKGAHARKDVEKKPGASAAATEAEANLVHTFKNATDLKEPNKQDQALLEEYERLKNERLCVICLNKDKNVIFLPCAHFAACLECSMSLNSCPMCRAEIQARIRAFS